jgi:hypothetical protein
MIKRHLMMFTSLKALPLTESSPEDLGRVKAVVTLVILAAAIGTGPGAARRAAPRTTALPPGHTTPAHAQQRNLPRPGEHPENARTGLACVPVPSQIHCRYQGAWQMADLEAIHTVEDTETMQTLIVGGAITGIGVFA